MLVVALTTTLLQGGAVYAAGAQSAKADVVTVSEQACAPGWKAPSAGQTVLTVHDVAKKTVYAIELVASATGDVYGQIATLAPGTEATMDLDLPPGQYFFECIASSGTVHKSAVEQVTGPPVTAAPPYVPVGTQLAHQAVLTYRASASVWLARLKSTTGSLTTAIKADHLGSARALWLSAHLAYARLDGAYDIAGTSNQAIDGLPNGQQGGVANPFFTGFLRLEYGLWHGQSASELSPIAAALGQAVATFAAQFAKTTLPLSVLGSNIHGNLEATQEVEMSGESDQGSHTNLATAWANVEGTQMALDALAPVLTRADPALVTELHHGLATLATTLRDRQGRDGTWQPVQDLTTSEREHLDGDFDSVLEELAVVPGLLQVPTVPRGGSS